MPRRSPIFESFWGGVHLMLLLGTAATSSVSPSREEQISPFARGAARHQLQRLRKVYNGADAQLSSPFLTDSKPMEGRVGFPVKPASVSRVSLHDEGTWQVFNEKWNDFEEERPRRMLQGTCDGEFSITSNVVSLLEGCFTASGTMSTANGQDTYSTVPDSQGGTAVVYAVFFATYDPPLRWVIEYWYTTTVVISSTTSPTTLITWYCYSVESADEVHPADATWICNWTDVPYSTTEVTDLEMDVTCGCSGITPSPSTLVEPVATSAPFTPSPVIITSAPFSVVGSPIMPSSTVTMTCDGEFSVTSNVAPVLEGCFQETESKTTSTINGQEVYGMVPDSQGGATFVYAVVFDTADPPLRWVIEYYASDTATVGTWYCYSDESADEVHPADATWICDLSGAATDSTEVTALEMGVACGCSGITPSTSTLIEPVDTVAPFTPSPVITTSAPFSVVESPMPSSTVTVTLTPPTPSPVITTSAPFSVVESPMPSSTVTVTLTPPTPLPVITTSAPFSVVGSPMPSSTVMGTLAPPTPSPVIITSAPFSVVGSPMPSSTVTVTCDGEFSITSNVAPVLEGCFQNIDSETTSTTNGEEIYEMVPDSQEGGTTFLFARVIDTLDPPLRWVMVYSVSGTFTAGASYCYSDETADEVHPVDATWICDLSGEASAFTEVTALNLAVACGCSGITPLKSSSFESEEQEETDSTLTFFAFSKFVTVLVVFTATVVLLV